MSDERREQLARMMVANLPRWGSWAVNIRDVVTPYGKLGFRQNAILWTLRHELVPPDELSPTSLAHQQRVRPSVITRALSRLEAGGFIERTMDLGDRRRIHIELTDKGREVSIYIERMYLREIISSMSGLDDAEIDRLQDAVQTLTGIIADLEAKGYELAPLENGPVQEEPPT